MECLYAPELSATQHNIALSGDEFTHLRALRLREGSRVLLSNGVGLSAVAVVQALHAKHAILQVTEAFPERSEQPVVLHLALGILDNRERLEFAVEKGTELGMNDFTPLLTTYSQRDRTNTERLQSKALAAMKQSQRSRLPRIHAPKPLQTLFASCQPETVFILADAEGAEPEPFVSASVCVLVGAEGGFSEEERALIAAQQPLRWRLAPTRLRAETAAVVALAVAGVMNTQA
jgi:16S rRNA (uracil1498-N3)-methyltransferase